MICLSQSTGAMNVVKIMQLAATCPDTSRHTELLTPAQQRSAMCVGRCMLVCQHSPCMSSLTASVTSARFVGKHFLGLGFSRDTWGPIQGTSLLGVLTVEKLLQTGLTWGHTCKHIQHLKATSAGDVINLLPWNPTCTSTMSLGVSRTQYYQILYHNLLIIMLFIFLLLLCLLPSSLFVYIWKINWRVLISLI